MSDTNPLVSFIIPNYNGAEFIGVCLDSIKLQTFTSYEVIVVDDASTDNSVNFITSTYNWVKIIRLSKNSGFCVAVNTGIKASSGEYVALINNDVELDKDWLTCMVHAIQRYNDAFGISSKVINYYDRRLIDDAGDIYTREGLAFKRWNKLPDNNFIAKDKEVFSPSGAASVFSKRVLNIVGLWDEHFIAYLDDVDIGFRARLMGYKNYYEPSAVAYHMVSKSYGKNTVFMGSLVLRNNMAVIIKNMPLSLIASFLPWLIIGHLKTVKYVFSFGGGKAVIKGYVMLCKMLPYLMHARLSIKQKATIPPDVLKRAIFKTYNQHTGEYT